MPKNLSMNEPDWSKFLSYSLEQQNIAEFRDQLASLTGRELYELETLCLVNRYLIDRPVSYAFHRARITYPVSPMEIMRQCMIDGQVFLYVADANHISITEYVSEARWNPFSDQLEFIQVKYVFEADNGQDYYNVEEYYRNPDGTATYVIYEPIRGDNVHPKDWKVQMRLTIPYFPFVGIRWINNIGFLQPMKEAIIRLESAYRVIGAENIERMGLSLYLEGIRNIDDIKTAPRKMGRRVHILPKDARFHSPNPDAPGMELMVHEINNLHAAIEKASGVVSTEKVASLSGVSRQVAERPLVVLAEELRNRFSDGMMEVYDLVSVFGTPPELKISYRSLKYIDDKNTYLSVLDRAYEKNAITDQEYNAELRLLLDLDPEL